MANIDTLKAALVAAAADIVNDIDRYECLLLIDEWFAARGNVASLAANSISSYSIGGRTVTRSSSASGISMADQMYARIKEYLYLRGCNLISLSQASEVLNA
jgi:hypothetical protein